MAYYISLDGDDIGNKIARGYLENDESKLSQIIQELNSILTQIHNYLNSAGFEMIFFAADGIACKGKYLEFENFAHFLKNIGRPTYTFSAGIGSDLQSSFFALKYAKSVGKDTIALCEKGNLFKLIGSDA